MAEVFRGKYPALSKNALFGYGFHGVTAILAIYLALKAVNS